MNSFFSKMRGGTALPPRAPMRHIALSWLGGFLAIAAVAIATDISHVPAGAGLFRRELCIDLWLP